MPDGGSSAEALFRNESIIVIAASILGCEKSWASSEV